MNCFLFEHVFLLHVLFSANGTMCAKICYVVENFSHWQKSVDIALKPNIYAEIAENNFWSTLEMLF